MNEIEKRRVELEALRSLARMLQLTVSTETHNNRLVMSIGWPTVVPTDYYKPTSYRYTIVNGDNIPNDEVAMLKELIVAYVQIVEANAKGWRTSAQSLKETIRIENTNII